MKTTFRTSNDFHNYDTLDEALASAKRSAANDIGDEVTVFQVSPVYTVLLPLPAELVVTQVEVTPVTAVTA